MRFFPLGLFFAVAAFLTLLPQDGSAESLLGKLAPNSVRVNSYLNPTLELPAAGEGIGLDAAVEAVRQHIEEVRSGRLDGSGSLSAYWEDYRKVLDRWTELSEARPVHLDTKDKGILLARYLVGLRKGSRLGGFIAVDARDGSIAARLMWNEALEPLWQIDASTWAEASSVNDIPELAELVPFLDQYTAGIPIDPHDPRWTFIDGTVDDMPSKTQEERVERITWFNETHGAATGVTLKSKKVRRIATLKCTSVATSYAADWWTVRTGKALSTFVNAVGGQKGYGFDPRIVEARFFQLRQDRSIWSRIMGNWKTAPFTKDPVTGEGVPFSPRGLALSLCSMEKGILADPLVPSLRQYPVEANHFNMDARPVVTQIFTTGMFPKMTIAYDQKHASEADFPFSLAPNYGEPVNGEGLARALDTWGPHLAQHMQRTYFGGKARTSLTGMGVHCVLLVGYGMYEGRLHFIYRETFGNGSAGYLEDSFLGPAFRIMPAEYFNEAIAFPHRLYLEMKKLHTGADAALVADLTITTNRRRDPLSPDAFQVTVDGRACEAARLRERAPGQFKLWIPASATYEGRRIEIRARKRYFADGAARNGFGIALERRNGQGGWTVARDELEPIALD